MENVTILTWITFIPMLGVILIPFLPKAWEGASKWIALVLTLPQLAIAWFIFSHFNTAEAGFQFVHGPFPWISAFNIHYLVGIDSISVSMVLLTALISFVSVVASWGINKNLKAYFALLMLLDTGMMGTFVALDFFLFYVFWELMLLPMYFLIGIWGGPRREYAAIKFFLYTLLGSVFILIVMLALYLFSEGNLFDITQLANLDNHLGRLAVTDEFNYFRFFCWLGLFVGFAIKVPMFPFHTWLPDAHVEAPTAISVILAGVLLKMGTYGMLRFNYMLFPDITADCATVVAVFGVINIVYGAFCAMAQTDLKKLIAYSSVSHMGFVLLGMSAFTTAGINGAVLQMFNHGTITAMLFILVGVIYDRAHHRDINGFGGLYTLMPRYGVWIAFAFFAALGLPGLSGFIGEALVFMGAYKTFPALTIAALSGVVLGAAYLLWTIQRAFLGPVNEKYRDLPDISVREVISLLPLGVIVLILGVYPMPMIRLINASLVSLNEIVKPFLDTAGVVAGMF
ncbi:MAG: NADH-quinone oxidoreductase subunit M [Deltaproteobacteria bacterium]|nr:NADH-quinone oxidoreductase subunit M [Deltaproteobacteria bacterium]